MNLKGLSMFHVFRIYFTSILPHFSRFWAIPYDVSTPFVMKLKEYIGRVLSCMVFSGYLISVDLYSLKEKPQNREIFALYKNSKGKSI